jgi:hypothetical protein
MSNEQLNAFYEYVLSFYGEHGLYSMNVTRETVEWATATLIATLEEHGLEFCGDSVDRESVREIITAASTQHAQRMRAAIADFDKQFS